MEQHNEISSGCASAGSTRRLRWILAAVFTLFIVIVAVAYLGRIKAVYQLYWGKEELHRLFYEDVGMSDAWSSFIGVTTSFVYALAWVPLSLWTWRLLVWRFTARHLLVSFACWVLVYGHVPLVHALLGSDACFNQRTGEPLKWYVQQPNGVILLFDSSGFDSMSATQKLPVTPTICSAFARQKIIGRPNRIVIDVHSIEFFEPNTGNSRVWYSKATDGNIVLFDGSGFNPTNGEKLLPITKEIADQILSQADRLAEEARQLALEDAREKAQRDARERAAQEARITIRPVAKIGPSA